MGDCWVIKNVCGWRVWKFLGVVSDWKRIFFVGFVYDVDGCGICYGRCVVGDGGIVGYFLLFNGFGLLYFYFIVNVWWVFDYWSRCGVYGIRFFDFW